MCFYFTVKKKCSFNFPFIYIFFVLYFVAELVSFLLSPFHPVSRRLSGDLWRSIWIPLAFSLWKSVDMNIRNFYYAFWVTGAVVAVTTIPVTIVNLGKRGWLSGFRPAGFSGHPMTYSGLLIILLSSLIVYLVERFRYLEKLERFLLISGLFLILVGLILNRTRSAQIAVFLVLLFFLILKFRYKGIIITAIFGVILALMILLTPARYRWKHTLAGLKSGFNPSSSEGTRIILWKYAWREFLNRPITGNGPGTFREMINRYPVARKLASTCHAHNDYLQVLYETGMLGFITFFSFWFYALFKFLLRYLKEQDLYAGMVAFSISGILTAGFFECNLFDAEIVMLLYFLTGMILGVESKEREDSV